MEYQAAFGGLATQVEDSTFQKAELVDRYWVVSIKNLY